MDCGAPTHRLERPLGQIAATRDVSMREHCQDRAERIGQGVTDPGLGRPREIANAGTATGVLSITSRPADRVWAGGRPSCLSTEVLSTGPLSLYMYEKLPGNEFVSVQVIIKRLA